MRISRRIEIMTLLNWNIVKFIVDLINLYLYIKGPYNEHPKKPSFIKREVRFTGVYIFLSQKQRAHIIHFWSKNNEIHVHISQNIK